MIPASLETNYREEIIKVTTYGNPNKKMWSRIKLTKPGQTQLLLEYLHIPTPRRSAFSSLRA
jgi:hypothetical protein